MISKIFNEKEWQFELLTSSGSVLAAVYDEGEADQLQTFYKSMEERDKDLQQQSNQEEEMADFSWRSEDNKGGE